MAATDPPLPDAAPVAARTARIPLYDRFRQPWVTWDAVRAWWPWLFLAGGLLAVGWLFVKPAPPDRVVLAAGPAGGAYHWWAQEYAKTFADAGITLEVAQTFGSVDNYRRLDADAARGGGPLAADDGVTVARVQSGTCPEGSGGGLRAVASLYLEPVWVFHRGPPGWQWPDLRGKRVAVGPDGSGPRSIAERLLKANRIPTTSRPAPSTSPFGAAIMMADLATEAARPVVAPQSVAPVAFVPLADRSAADALRAGRVDAAVFVFSPRHPLVADPLKDPTLRLMSFDRHEAYARVFPFLSGVKLPRGTVDLAADLPRQDTYLLAPAANLVCRAGTHPAVVALLVQAATAAHERGDLLSRPAALPSTQFVEFPIDPAAADHFRHGPPLLQRLLPFRVAAFVDRMKILLLPLLTLLVRTLVVFGGEFGRTPYAENNDKGKAGRDHHHTAFSMLLAGGGVRGGLAFGTSDELGMRAERDPVHVHDLHATILALVGLDHERLTFRYAGRDFRLTDVHGRVVKEIFA